MSKIKQQRYLEIRGIMDRKGIEIWGYSIVPFVGMQKLVHLNSAKLTNAIKGTPIKLRIGKNNIEYLIVGKNLLDIFKK